MATGWERTVHTTLCLDLYSEQILVSCYDLEDGKCFLSVYLNLFGHKQPGKCVLFIFVFHIEHHWARLDVVFYALNLFLHLQITSVCKKHTSPVKKK